MQIEKVFSYWGIARDLFNLDLIIINDHSKDFWLTEDFIFQMPGKKVNWNQPAVRNYGARLAKGDKLLFTDIDHLIYGKLDVLDLVLMDNTYVKFERFIKTAGKYKQVEPHDNSFLIKKDDFKWYDEDFCGNYGFDDIEFFFRLNKTHRKIIMSNLLGAYVFPMPSNRLSRDKTMNAEKLFSKTGMRR